MPVANMTITACPTCTGCPGFQVNAADPPSNSTSDDDDNDDENDDKDGNAKKRALAGRFDRQRREATVRDYVGSDRNKCYVTPFTMKPAYRKYLFLVIPPVSSHFSIGVMRHVQEMKNVTLLPEEVCYLSERRKADCQIM